MLTTLHGGHLGRRRDLFLAQTLEKKLTSPKRTYSILIKLAKLDSYNQNMKLSLTDPLTDRGRCLEFFLGKFWILGKNWIFRFWENLGIFDVLDFHCVGHTT